MTTAGIGVGNIGGGLWRGIWSAAGPVSTGPAGGSNAAALAGELGPLATQQPSKRRSRPPDVVVFAVQFDALKQVIARVRRLARRRRHGRPIEPARHHPQQRLSGPSRRSVRARWWRCYRPAPTTSRRSARSWASSLAERREPDSAPGGAVLRHRRRPRCRIKQLITIITGFDPVNHQRRERSSADRNARRRPAPGWRARRQAPDRPGTRCLAAAWWDPRRMPPQPPPFRADPQQGTDRSRLRSSGSYGIPPPT